MVVSTSPSSSSSVPHLTMSGLRKSPRKEFTFDGVFLCLCFPFDPFLYFPSLCSNSPICSHVWPLFYTQPFNILVTFIFKFQCHDCSIWVTLSLVVLTALSLANELIFHCFFECLLSIGEGNGNPLQCSCLENSRDRGAWWAAVYGVAQSWTRLK